MGSSFYFYLFSFGCISFADESLFSGAANASSYRVTIASRVFDRRSFLLCHLTNFLNLNSRALNIRCSIFVTSMYFKPIKPDPQHSTSPNRSAPYCLSVLYFRCNWISGALGSNPAVDTLCFVPTGDNCLKQCLKAVAGVHSEELA